MTRGDGGEQALAARRVTMGGGREQVKHREKKKKWFNETQLDFDRSKLKTSH